MNVQDLFRLTPDVHHALEGAVLMTTICSIRSIVIGVMFPPLDVTVLPAMVRTGLLVILSFYVAFGQSAELIDGMSAPQLLAMACREVIIGLVLGLSASSVFLMAHGAGTLVDDLTGYNNVQIVNPSNPVTFTPTAMLFSQIASMVFWTMGGMQSLLAVIYESYHWWPLTSETPIVANILESFAIQQTENLMEGMLKLAAPIMLLLLLVDVGFGLIARAAPRLDLISLTQPVKAGVMVMVLVQFVGLFIHNLRGELTLIHLPERLHSVAATMAASGVLP
ncbi:MAG: type III secretion system export apparatus subunit SctT [Burkholderiaceae bacterium]